MAITAAALPWIIGAAAVSAGASIYGGIQANNASKKEAALLDKQGQIAQDEANTEADAHAKDVRRFAASQSLSFLANGVTLQGSPLLVADDTFTQGQAEVDSIRKSGAAQRELYNQRGVIARNQGRASLIGGIGAAAGTAATTGLALKKAE